MSYHVNHDIQYQVTETLSSWVITAGGITQHAGTLKCDDPDGTYAEEICRSMRAELEDSSPADRCKHGILGTYCPSCFDTDPNFIPF